MVLSSSSLVPGARAYGVQGNALDSEVFLSSTDGVLELTLWAEKADFRFVSTADETLDAGFFGV